MTMIVLRSLRQHLLSTLVTMVSTALGVGLVIAVFLLSGQSERAFSGGPVGFDAVLGARGSQLQLVLNTVFHLETSPGNIPWSLYQSMRRDPRVELKEYEDLEAGPVTVHAFYVRFLLPIWFDVQVIESAPGSEPARRWRFA